MVNVTFTIIQLAPDKLHHGVLFQSQSALFLNRCSQRSFALIKGFNFSREIETGFLVSREFQAKWPSQRQGGSFSKRFQLYWVSQNLYLYTYANWHKALTFHSAAAEDALDHRRMLARTLRTAVLILWQRVANFEQQIPELALWTVGVFRRFLVGRDHGIGFGWTAPSVRAAAVGVVGWDAAIFNAVRLVQFDVTADLDASFVLRHRLFCVETARANTAVT